VKKTNLKNIHATKKAKPNHSTLTLAIRENKVLEERYIKGKREIF